MGSCRMTPIVTIATPYQKATGCSYEIPLVFFLRRCAPARFRGTCSSSAPLVMPFLGRRAWLVAAEGWLCDRRGGRRYDGRGPAEHRVQRPRRHRGGQQAAQPEADVPGRDRDR